MIVSILLWLNSMFWIFCVDVPAMAWFGIFLQIAWLFIEVTEVFK